MTSKSAVAVIVGTVASILLASTVASAQQAVSPPPTLKTEPPPSTAGTDHDGVVSHIGVTIFPTQAIPLPVIAGGVGVLPAPTLGVRYWIMPNLGIDAGLGLGWYTGSTPLPFAMAFHAGLPLALASAGHFTFEVVPEANLAFAHENVPVPGMANNTADGFLFDIGARVGAEIQFGFIGIPQLALEGSVGLLLTHTDSNTNVGGMKGSANTTSLATTVGTGSPWAIFANAIQATYYL
jgi:hypothetical protein